MKKGNKYGTHRVISPKGVLPQPADKLDNNMDEIYDNEILIDVQTLNIDSASFTQIEEQAGGDKAKIAEIMMDIVAKQGKHRNPVTGSGGMLLGTVEKIGDALVGKTDLKVGDKIATLVSLSLTPLRIDKIKEIKVGVVGIGCGWRSCTDGEVGEAGRHGADYRRRRQIGHVVLL